MCELNEEGEVEAEQQQRQTEEEEESTTIKAVRLSPNGHFHFSAAKDEEEERGKENDDATTTTVDNTSTTTKTTSTSIDGNLDSHRGENSHSKNNTAEVAYNIQSDYAGGTTLSLSSAFTAFMPLQHQSMESKIQAGLFTNSLISISDLLTGNYDPEIINNIDRVHPNSDRWFCYNCTLRDDKWGMMKHLCRHNKKTKRKKEI